MSKLAEIMAVVLVGLITTSSSIFGAAIGLYASLSKRILSCVLAFAAGSLISALAIDLAYKGAMELHQKKLNAGSAWEFIAGGFAIGAIIYFVTSMYLEKKGAAIKRPMRFREYALNKKQEESKALVGLLSQCELLRNLEAESIENILHNVRQRQIRPGEVVFHAGDPSDSFFIVSKGYVEVFDDQRAPGKEEETGKLIAKLGPGNAFGEMGLISGSPRTATILSSEGAEVLELEAKDFNELMESDPVLSRAVSHLSHERAIKNLTASGSNPSTWAKVAMDNIRHISRGEQNKLLQDAGKGAGMAIVLGNILDTIPGCLVIGASFKSFGDLSFTLMLGMFLGGIPESAVSAAMLSRAGYKAKKIFLLWSAVLIAGMAAAVMGKELIGTSESMTAVFCEAVSGGAVLALVTHAMIPEAIHEGGSIVVLPTVAGFLFSLFLAMTSAW
ncbi:MAG TPA: cyclic nucleotide-binding domain-containing protein [Puia sp.]|nr:cyclic nucleotide-binding domain-containing protein [Puia sp.]